MIVGVPAEPFELSSFAVVFSESTGVALTLASLQPALCCGSCMSAGT